MQALEEEARHVIGGRDGGGTLHIGTMESSAASRLPEPLAAYHRDYPETRLEVSTGPSAALIEQVRQERLDCALVALPQTPDSPSALDEQGLQTLPLWEEELLLLLPSSDSSATIPEEICTRSLAAFAPGCSYRAIAENRLGIVAGSDWRIQEPGSYHAMIAAVAAGACVCVLPRSVLALCTRPAGLATLALGKVRTHLVWRSGYEVPAFERFIPLLQTPSE